MLLVMLSVKCIRPRHRLKNLLEFLVLDHLLLAVLILMGNKRSKVSCWPQPPRRPICKSGFQRLREYRLSKVME